MIVAVPVVLLLALLVAVGVAAAIGTARVRARYEAEKAALLAGARAVAGREVLPAGLAALPPPVRAYVEGMRAAGVPAATAAILEQRGALRTAPDQPWMPFVAEQAYSMEPPGFVWLARARVAPLVHIVARDAFVGGRGSMLVRLLGLVTLADARGPELDLGAALRYWGETLAFPERLLDRRVRWEAVDDRHARMIVEHDGLSVAAVVAFDGDGRPAGVRANRFRDVAGRGVLTPWSGLFGEWKVIDGRPFPSRWEAVWHLPEGDFSAVQMEILRVETP